MRKVKWIRYGLGSMIVAGVGMAATLLACGDDDDVGFVPDAGKPETAVTETSTPDTGTDATKPADNFAKLTFINAATDLGSANEDGPGGPNAGIRICFEQSVAPAPLSVAPYPPLPDTKPNIGTPGIKYGTGGTFPSFGLDLENRTLKPYIMSAKTLKAKGVLNPNNGSPGTTCDELVGGTKKATFNLMENVDYWILPEIPAGTFKKDKAYVIALVGCVGDATATPALCGPAIGGGVFVPGAAGRGNLSAIIKETTRTPLSAAGRGIQFFYASAQANATFGGAGPLTPGFVTRPDGGDFDASVYTNATAAPAVYGELSPALDVSVDIDNQLFAMNKVSPVNPAAPLAPIGLNLIQVFSGLTGLPNVPTVYVAGKNYVFVAVGDPNRPTYQAADGGAVDASPADFSTASFHYLAFPTDPVIEPYNPKP